MKKIFTSLSMQCAYFFCLLGLSAQFFGDAKLLAQPQTLVGAELPREISVTAETQVRASATSASITVRIYGDGATAKEAADKCQEITEKLQQSLITQGIEGQLTARGRQYLSAGNQKFFTPLTRAATIGLEQFLSLTTDKLEKVPAIIDSLLAVGAESIVEVSYLSPAEGEHSLSAINRATIAAQAKATKLAQALNMRLGPPISVVVNEEPIGAGLREQMQQGKHNPAYDEYYTTLYLTVRYQLQTVDN